MKAIILDLSENLDREIYRSSWLHDCGRSWVSDEELKGSEEEEDSGRYLGEKREVGDKKAEEDC